jgi:UDP-N-acetylglucosamine--N-acetylmuramyl-(pentapeptide) pyrophosphoryl-undecaprenol N-acetylglucosamine transferase
LPDGIAEAFIEREKGNEVLFIGTEKGIETRILAGGRFPLRTIPIRPMTGRSLLEKIKVLWNIPMTVSEALSILKEFFLLSMQLQDQQSFQKNVFLFSISR